jgi:nicotinate-nucleotide adenylyltransferase
MTVIATAADERFSVSRVDVDRDGPTYTVDTLRDIGAALGADHDYYFITGADALEEILSWREPDEVLRLAHLVGVTRPGHVLADPGLAPGRITLLEIPALAISSSDIRARVARAEPIRYLVTPGVEAYVAKVGLYSR